MNKAMSIISKCYELDIDVTDVSQILDAAGYKGYTWENVADFYEAIYCAEEGK